MRPVEKNKILIDTSSAILIYKAGLLPAITGNYRVTGSRSVYDELSAEGHPGHDEFAACFRDGRMAVSYEYRSCLLDLPLRGGERDIILLYLSGEGKFVLIDDKKGSRYCRENAIPHTNALMMARVLGQAGCINEEGRDAACRRLMEIGRYSGAVRDYALGCAPGELRFFYP